eukprot:CAMPEP_0171108078 /NCGR_PEP_ID=MMETSP0766_2-20121228/68125_1 /TAXON_ID=439317 /ORGANISM="Gambierdiscus australes, Strain CAWD 149" /LENGTH=53 /DNA_ID=CAMNT_0011569515 /DNA_START=58 /DNA_END=216 /DNA_ORIENTATION=+
MATEARPCSNGLQQRCVPQWREAVGRHSDREEAVPRLDWRCAVGHGRFHLVAA